MQNLVDPILLFQNVLEFAMNTYPITQLLRYTSHLVETVLSWLAGLPIEPRVLGVLLFS